MDNIVGEMVASKLGRWCMAQDPDEVMPLLTMPM